MAAMVDAAAERLKAEGNALFQRGRWQEALSKYDEALGGPDGRGGGMGMEIGATLLLNRAACHLEIADRAPSSANPLVGVKLDSYCRAAKDAAQARRSFQVYAKDDPKYAKALLRQARGQLGRCREMIWKMDKAFAEGGGDYGRAMREVAPYIVGGEDGLDEAAVVLGTCAALRPDDPGVKKARAELERLRAKLAAAGVPPRSTAVPAPQPSAFAAGVVFTEGATWMENTVALEVAVPCGPAPPPEPLPVFLQKQANTNNLGEPAIWIMYSDHLGAAELARRAALAGLDPELLGEVPYWGPLTEPAGRGELQAPDEFILSLKLQREPHLRAVPAALVAAGVIERVRVAGVTQFGEEHAVYRVKF